jgi:hypothetical protein
MKKYNYLAGALALVFALSFNSCKKDDSGLEGLMGKPESTVPSGGDFTSSNPITGSGTTSSNGDTAITNTSCRCPGHDASSIIIENGY